MTARLQSLLTCAIGRAERLRWRLIVVLMLRLKMALLRYERRLDSAQ